MTALAWLLPALALGCAASRGGGAGGSGPGGAAPAGQPPPDTLHAHELADLSRDGPYPRFSPSVLAASGYPDHGHAFFWPGWRPPVAEDGRPYGPGALCVGETPADRPDLRVSPGRIAHGPWVLIHDPAYGPCDLMPYAELAGWARVRCRDLLGLASPETLYVVSPLDLKEYGRMTGYGSWRLYRQRGDTCVVEPVPTLFARTLAAHVAIETIVLHELDAAAPGALPVWLRYGLAAYVADMGVHLNNFMAPYRREGPVLMPPARIDSVLAAPPAPDAARDQREFRCASYGAFVMAWRLVEDHGGLGPVRGLLSRLARGEAFATACRDAWGAAPAELAARLDPTVGAEPIGDAVQQRQPNTPPRAR